ncbi:MAG: hypothetical protein ABGY09_02120 [Euryarchaeota archaeon]
MGALTVTISGLSTLLLAVIAYTVGSVGRMIGSRAVAVAGPIALGVTAGTFLVVPALTDLPAVVSEFWSGKPVLAKVTASPSDLPKVVKELRRLGAKTVDRRVRLELTMGERVNPERQRWIERKVRIAFPGVVGARFVGPSKLVLVVDTSRVRLEDVPKLADRVSWWITYTSGYVVVGASSVLRVRAGRSALARVQEEFRGLVNVKVLYDPSRVVRERVARSLPSPLEALAMTVSGFALLGVTGWYGVVGRAVSAVGSWCRKVRSRVGGREGRVVRLGKVGKVRR